MITIDREVALLELTNILEDTYDIDVEYLLSVKESDHVNIFNALVRQVSRGRLTFVEGFLSFEAKMDDGTAKTFKFKQPTAGCLKVQAEKGTDLSKMHRLIKLTTGVECVYDNIRHSGSYSILAAIMTMLLT